MWLEIVLQYKMFKMLWAAGHRNESTQYKPESHRFVCSN